MWLCPLCLTVIFSSAITRALFPSCEILAKMIQASIGLCYTEHIYTIYRWTISPPNAIIPMPKPIRRDARQTSCGECHRRKQRVWSVHNSRISRIWKIIITILVHFEQRSWSLWSLRQAVSTSAMHWKVRIRMSDDLCPDKRSTGQSLGLDRGGKPLMEKLRTMSNLSRESRKSNHAETYFQRREVSPMAIQDRLVEYWRPSTVQTFPLLTHLLEILSCSTFVSRLTE